MIVLAYLWPLALVPLFAGKHDPEVQWHARHGLVLAVAETLLLIALMTLTSFASLVRLGLGLALLLVVVCLFVAILALHAAAIIKGLAGGRLSVPGVSQLAAKELNIGN
jgi:hypothetical protein